jgi:hypothetical protein
MSHPNAASATCMACGEAGHRALRCKSIGVPPHGFHTGGNGGGGHSHDDDDEKAAASSYKQVVLAGPFGNHMMVMFDFVFKNRIEHVSTSNPPFA